MRRGEAMERGAVPLLEPGRGRASSPGADVET